MARLLVECPPGTTPGVASLLADLLEEPPLELTLLHPSSWAPERAAAWAHHAGYRAARVRALPAALPVGGPGPRVVVDAGHGGTELSLIDAGSVRASRFCDVGGARLDGITLDLLEPAPGAGDRPAALAEARRVRERLSLFPTASARLGGRRVALDAERLRRALSGPLQAVVDAVRELTPDPAYTEVVLIGGLARMPLLAELLDAAQVRRVTVAERPDVAAVLAALDEPGMIGNWASGAASFAAPAARSTIMMPSGTRTAGPPSARPGAATSTGRPPVTAPPGDGSSSAGLPATARPWARMASDGTSPARYLPPVPVRPRHPVRLALTGLAGVALVGGLIGAGGLLTPQPPAAGAAAEATAAGLLVQYGYRLRLPAGWEHTGGLPERRRTLITPAEAPDGSDLISIERTDLGYDAAAEPARALAELRAEYDAAVAGGAPLSGFDPAARLAGRMGIGYRQAMADGVVVDWFVVLDGGAQLSVGCRHTPAGAARVDAACAAVVGSLRRS
ncbi:type VII secretion-associated protein [Pseudonocardia bannensis]|uniref:Type VII secretion-associated protein n=1 Tax=Pseudonocardia bannensis TaxID=630973 RepID=A0A848DR66_9PSEU|nr:type VII secretion-associated protein [Pseudonocardia bannensis]NMH95238.1 type VII secretion-associated protein [Pseudonocardia bannensis]